MGGMGMLKAISFSAHLYIVVPRRMYSRLFAHRQCLAYDRAY